MPAAAEIADDRLSGVETDPRHAQHYAARRPARAKSLGIDIELQRAGDRAGGMVGLICRRAEQHMHGVADDLYHRAAMGKHDIGHAAEIIVEQWRDDVRFERFH